MKGSEFTYDEICRAEFCLLQSRIEHLFVDIEIACPYGLPHCAVFHQATFAPLNDRAMELFLAAGYRRNGNCLYSMHCGDCQACIPIRLHPGEFQPNRNQKRAKKKNHDIEGTVSTLNGGAEDLELCDLFLQKRYPGRTNSAGGYYRDFFLNNIVNSVQIHYRVKGRLVGTSILDIGVNWVNAVYFFFDPQESWRSLGTYNIVHLVELCRKWGVGYLYLGYLIREVSAMNYKERFLPHYLLLDKKWRKIEK